MSCNYKEPCCAPYLKSSKTSPLNILATVTIWIQRSRQRKQLSRLDQHLLEDIGLTLEQAKQEVEKPFWR